MIAQVQVGAAHRAGADLEEQLSGLWLGLGQIGRPERLALAFEDYGAHAWLEVRETTICGREPACGDRVARLPWTTAVIVVSLLTGALGEQREWAGGPLAGGALAAHREELRGE
jgi:hypothetical protein